MVTKSHLPCEVNGFVFSKKRWLPTAVGKDTFKNNLRELVIEYVCHEALDELCFNLYIWDSRNYTMIWSNVWETQILILYIRDAWLKCQNDALMLEMFLILNVDLKVTTVVTFPPATGGWQNPTSFCLNHTAFGSWSSTNFSWDPFFFVLVDVVVNLLLLGFMFSIILESTSY